MQIPTKNEIPGKNLDLKSSKIPKFGREMLENTENMLVKLMCSVRKLIPFLSAGKWYNNFRT